MVQFPSALPPVGGPSSGMPFSDLSGRAQQDAQDIAAGFDHLQDRLGQLYLKPSLIDDGAFIGQFVGDLTYVKSTLAKVEQDKSDGKITAQNSLELLGEDRKGGIVGDFYEICDTPVGGLRLSHVMDNLDPPPMTDAAHYCQSLVTESRPWLEDSMLPRLREMSQQLHGYKG